MRITTKGRYGLRAVINLARTNHNRPVSIGSIASEENVSSEFLEQIFFKLKKAGLIRSIRGPGGGFVLNRTPAEISVQDILDARNYIFRMLAVSVDGQIVARKDYKTTRVPDGADVQVIHMISGG